MECDRQPWDRRRWHTPTLLPSGKVLVAGGYMSWVWQFLSSAELYDPAVGTWTATGSLGTGRDAHTATLLPYGKVLVAGGSGNSGILNSAELYDPAVGTWMHHQHEHRTHLPHGDAAGLMARYWWQED